MDSQHNDLRKYCANVTGIGSYGKSFRRKIMCQGRTADHAALHALKQIWRLMPGMRHAQVGGIRWLKDC